MGRADIPFGGTGGALDQSAHELTTRLSGEALTFWTNREVCLWEFEGLYARWRFQEPDYNEHLARIDEWIRSGMAALGFPRGPVRTVELMEGSPGFSGRKTPACTIELGAEYLRRRISTHTPDAVVRTWVHESLHARQPYRMTWAREWVPHPGYEEGMVDGLADWLVRAGAAMEPGGLTYPSFVQAYRVLASILGVRVTDLWRTLWATPTGLVRAALIEQTQVTWHTLTGKSLGVRRWAREWAEIADPLFKPSASAMNRSYDETEAIWRRLLT